VKTEGRCVSPMVSYSNLLLLKEGGIILLLRIKRVFISLFENSKELKEFNTCLARPPQFPEGR